MTPTFRWDVTGDYRGFQKAPGGGITNSTAYTVTPGANVTITHLDPATGTIVTDYSGPSTQINKFAVQRRDELRLANHTLLANFYHDFNRAGVFNPYVGVGVGAAVREGRDNYSQRATCVSTTNSLDVPHGQQPCLLPDTSKSGSPSNTHFGAAAALMAGVTYEFSKGVMLDAGYRAIWQGGNMTIKSLGDTITADSRTDHEFRTGIRWNIW